MSGGPVEGQIIYRVIVVILIILSINRLIHRPFSLHTIYTRSIAASASASAPNRRCVWFPSAGGTLAVLTYNTIAMNATDAMQQNCEHPLISTVPLPTRCKQSKFCIDNMKHERKKQRWTSKSLDGSDCCTPYVTS